MPFLSNSSSILNCLIFFVTSTFRMSLSPICWKHPEAQMLGYSLAGLFCSLCGTREAAIPVIQVELCPQHGSANIFILDHHTGDSICNLCGLVLLESCVFFLINLFFLINILKCVLFCLIIIFFIFSRCVNEENVSTSTRIHRDSWQQSYLV